MLLAGIQALRLLIMFCAIKIMMMWKWLSFLERCRILLGLS